jgi:hypothetical protein
VSDDRRVSVQVTKYDSGLIEHEYIGGLAGQFADKRPLSFLRRDVEIDDPIVGPLFHGIDSRAPEMRPQKLTERRRHGWIGYRSADEMQTRCVGTA